MIARHDLEATARQLVDDNRGILAADESTETVTKRLAAMRITSTPDTRRAFRELLVNTPGVAEFISGVILYDETIRQRTSDGATFPEAVERAGMIAGVKVDTGAKAMAGRSGETVTEGLDGLRRRLDEYRYMGARFATWRAVITIGGPRPTTACVAANAYGLTRYAAICQDANLVPIVDADVVMDGDHTLDRCGAVTETMLVTVFERMREDGIELERMLLRPNMVLAGCHCREQASAQEVADATVRCLRRAVPATVPGIVFHSGAQDERLATVHLNAINRRGPQPWELSFSYGGALHAAALAAWRGDDCCIAAGQDAFLHRARCNAMARAGAYSESMETYPSACKPAA